MNFSQTDISRIIIDGPEAGRFSFAFEPDIDRLAASIESVGLMHPPLLRRAGERFEVVCGYRRVRALQRLGLRDVPAFVCDEDELSDERCLRLSLIDSEWCGRLTPVEQATALRKFSQAGYLVDRLLEEIAPHLGLPRSRALIENHLRLLSLENEILHAVHVGQFGLEQAFLLLPVEPESRLPLFRLLESCKANLNETRELIPLTSDVAAMRGKSLADFIVDDAEALLSKESRPSRKGLQILRGFLIRERQPSLSAAESKFKRLAEGLVGPACRIEPPKYFEGNDITITIRAASSEQVDDVVRKLSAPESDEKLKSLFSILRGCDSR